MRAFEWVGVILGRIGGTAPTLEDRITHDQVIDVLGELDPESLTAFMSTRVEYQEPPGILTVDTAWRLLAQRDFAGLDGKPNILWRNFRTVYERISMGDLRRDAIKQWESMDVPITPKERLAFRENAHRSSRDIGLNFRFRQFWQRAYYKCSEFIALAMLTFNVPLFIVPRRVISLAGGTMQREDGLRLANAILADPDMVMDEIEPHRSSFTGRPFPSSAGALRHYIQAPVARVTHGRFFFSSAAPTLADLRPRCLFVSPAAPNVSIARLPHTLVEVDIGRGVLRGMARKMVFSMLRGLPVDTNNPLRLQYFVNDDEHGPHTVMIGRSFVSESEKLTLTVPAGRGSLPWANISGYLALELYALDMDQWLVYRGQTHTGGILLPLELLVEQLRAPMADWPSASAEEQRKYPERKLLYRRAQDDLRRLPPRGEGDAAGFNKTLLLLQLGTIEYDMLEQFPGEPYAKGLGFHVFSNFLFFEQHPKFVQFKASALDCSACGLPHDGPAYVHMETKTLVCGTCAS